jgi:hypothetical protein
VPIDIRVTETFTDDDRHHLAGWGENVFGTLDVPLEWRSRDCHIMLYDDSYLASHVGLLKQTITVGGRPVVVGGVGAVITVLDRQGRGFARAAMRFAHDYMCDQLGVEFGMLFCFERLVPFYEPLGWRRLDVPVWVDQPSGPVEMPMVTMVRPCGQAVWPPGPVELGSLPW